MNIITKIEIQKKNKDRVNIFVDDEYAFALSAELVYKENLKVKDKIDREKLEKVSKEEGYLKCKNTALRIIERSYKSEKEIQKKLMEKGYDNVSIKRTLEFLQEYNLQNDESYTKMFIKDKIKTQGTNKIKYSLKQKGINQDLIAEELSTIDKEDEDQVAYDLAVKKYSVLSKRESDKYKLSQKLYRFLISRGYGYDIVSSVVKRVVDGEEY